MTEGSAAFHTPEELLAGAQSLLDSHDPGFARAAILEAITALEAYVGQVVFRLLESKLDPLLVKWLRERTKLDFDARLSVLVPLATERSVIKGSDLWSRYKRAKQIRNEVTHSGRQVTFSEAEEVVETIFDWLSYLGSAAELDVLLLNLKKHIEFSSDWKNIDSTDHRNIWEIYEARILEYFEKVRFSDVERRVQVKVGNSLFEIDFVARIGSRRVAIEIRSASVDPGQLDTRLELATRAVRRLLLASIVDSGVVVLLFRGALPEKYRKMEKRDDGRVTILPVLINQ